MRLLLPKTQKRIIQYIPYIVLTIIAANFIWPLLWLFLSSFDSEAVLNLKLPTTWSLDNYKQVLSNPINFGSFVNSLLISTGHASGVLALSLLAAYPLSRMQMKNKGAILYSMLFLTGLPITALMIPVYIVFFRFNIVDSLWSTTLFLIATSLPYSVWMMKNFLDDVPKELEEAARLDGAKTFPTIFHIILPVILPGVIVVFIFNFASSWGNFFVPYVLLNSPDKIPASVTIFQYFGSYGSVAYGQLAAYALLYTLPVMFLYALSQKFMSSGFSLGGAVK